MDYEESFFARKYYAPTDVVSGYQVRPGFYLRNGGGVRSYRACRQHSGETPYEQAKRRSRL